MRSESTDQIHRLAGVSGIAGALLFFVGDMLFYGHFGPGAEFAEGMLSTVMRASPERLFAGGLVGPIAACLCIAGFWHVYLNIRPSNLFLGRLMLGVELALALQRRAYVRAEGRDFELTRAGRIWLKEFGVDWQALKNKKRSFAPQCLDWTERRYHIAGALGSALLIRMFELGWLKKAWAPRLVTLTTKGELELSRRLSVVARSGPEPRRA